MIYVLSENSRYLIFIRDVGLRQCIADVDGRCLFYLILSEHQVGFLATPSLIKDLRRGILQFGV